MKALFLFLAASIPVQAQIQADFTIDDGSGTDKVFTVELFFSLNPRSVANFIGLASGTRPWIDSSTGLTMANTPYYNGQIIYRAIDDFPAVPTESAIWIGSQSGEDIDDPYDGPGYYIQDEFGATVGSPRNIVWFDARDPHGGGGKLIIASSQNTLNHPDLVPIGQVLQFTPGPPVETSQLNVLGLANVATDSNDKPVLTHTIEDVTIRRSSLPAQQFNELSPTWNLPEVGGSGLILERKDGVPLLRFSEDGSAAGGVFLRSPDLMTWSAPVSFYQGPGNPEGADLSAFFNNFGKYYFRGNSITYPTTPSSDVPLSDAAFQFVFASQIRSLTIAFSFNEDGDGGTWFLTNAPGVNGDITLVEYRAEGPYTNTLFISGDNGLPNFFFRILHDINLPSGLPTGTSISTNPGRLQGYEWTLEEIVPGFEVRTVVPNSEFPFGNSTSIWAYFPAP